MKDYGKGLTVYCFCILGTSVHLGLGSDVSRMTAELPGIELVRTLVESGSRLYTSLVVPPISAWLGVGLTGWCKLQSHVFVSSKFFLLSFTNGSNSSQVLFFSESV